MKRARNGVMTRVIVAIVAYAAIVIAIDYARASGIEFSCRENVTVGIYENNTVWSIVEGNCTGNLSAAQDAVVKKYGTLIVPGQVLVLPSDR
jgi:hypothetical protein